MTNDNEIEKIVAGLSEAQRKLFSSMSQYPGAQAIWQYPATHNTLQSVAALWKRDLVETSDEFDGPDAWERGGLHRRWGFVALTPLGLAVRNALQREKAHD